MLKLLLLLFPICLLAYAKSDHFDGKKFFNPEANHEKTFWDVLKWKIKGGAASWPENLSNKAYPLPELAPTDKAAITFINHSTFLIRLQGLTILTDPIFSERASPIKFIGPKRVRLPGLSLEELPPLDVVLISHNHYDHLDLESLKLLDGKFHPLFLVPVGDEKLLKQSGIQHVREMDWWQSQKVKDIQIHFTPAQHWSGRGFFDRNQSLWGSFMLVAPVIRIYFGGDTGYSSHFRETKEKLGAPDLALLPIGAYKPRDFMQVSHMNPEEASKAHQDLEAKYSLGMHFGTFQLTDEPFEEPVERLRSLKLKDFGVLDQGETRLWR